MTKVRVIILVAVVAVQGRIMVMTTWYKDASCARDFMYPMLETTGFIFRKVVAILIPLCCVPGSGRNDNHSMPLCQKYPKTA